MSTLYNQIMELNWTVNMQGKFYLVLNAFILIVSASKYICLNGSNQGSSSVRLVIVQHALYVVGHGRDNSLFYVYQHAFLYLYPWCQQHL